MTQDHDDELRRAFHALADQAPVELDAVERGRVLDGVVTQGQALIADEIDSDELQDELSNLADEASPMLDASARARVLDRARPVAEFDRF